MIRSLLTTVVFCIMAFRLASDVPLRADENEVKNEVFLETVGQNWTEADMEVWNTAVQYWTVSEMDELMKHFHEDYMGWNVNDPMPLGKSSARTFITHDLNTYDLIITKLSPVGLKVYGDIAIADYHFFRVLKLKQDGKDKIETGRFTDILKKVDGKWLLIGDHGGALEK